MKKVFLALAVAAVFVACDSKKKEGEENKAPETTTTPAGDTSKTAAPAAGDTGKTAAPAAGDTGKTKMENLKDAAGKVGEAVKDAKAGDMKGAADKGKEALDAGKKAVGH